ncbi:hypothetical protein EDI_024350 [Entamoeba dispar SAW760]|uniref:Uncharacterized protein n=1 Tax=Entamoeba dispar (strain ATCC PRA-260 / SAW760) TaxID=370354 RepID=B0EHE2_ENTDS|nr:uncharacterized protein EDI_024350 [Entamoeba dispar SAW760]EDR26047.1 hypothetical protein EDI_024350 [Entamoeba dispar SAW760]|eukprot:EDR26047.1 hypothetical protein EDI_024350 [Entamoeba dispar SAW760]
MRFFAILALTFVLSACAQSSGFWMPTLYRVQERLGEVAMRLDEVEDEERHVGDMIDENIKDLENVITKREKYVVGRKLTHLRSKMVVYHTKKLALLRVMKKIVKSIPRKFRARMIRRLRLEKRFNAIRDIARDAKYVLKSHGHISHKADTKKTLKRLGHGIYKNTKGKK